MPTTEAGKAWMKTPAAQVVTGMEAAIDAIEAEARNDWAAVSLEQGRAEGIAAERARIRAAVMASDWRSSTILRIIDGDDY